MEPQKKGAPSNGTHRSGTGLEVIFRWIHVLAGITWIGVLYYFNFIQTPFFGSELGGTGQGRR